MPVSVILPKDNGAEEDEEAEEDGAYGVSNARPKRARKEGREKEYGLMYHEYDWACHQFTAHLRQVHPGNPPCMMNVAGIEEQVPAKAADPFAKKGIPHYYYHSRTKLYIDIFFHFWDTVMGPTFCPWLTFDSQKSLDKLFDLHFEKLDYSIPSFGSIFT